MRFAVGEPFFFRRAERDLQRFHDPLRDIVLDGKDVGEIAVVAVRPQMRAVSRIDQLRRDAYTRLPARRMEHFQHRLHAEFAPRRCGYRLNGPCR